MFLRFNELSEKNANKTKISSRLGLGEADRNTKILPTDYFLFCVVSFVFSFITRAMALRSTIVVVLFVLLLFAFIPEPANCLSC